MRCIFARLTVYLIDSYACIQSAKVGEYHAWTHPCLVQHTPVSVIPMAMIMMPTQEEDAVMIAGLIYTLQPPHPSPGGSCAGDGNAGAGLSRL